MHFRLNARELDELEWLRIGNWRSRSTATVCGRRERLFQSLTHEHGPAAYARATTKPSEMGSRDRLVANWAQARAWSK